MTTPSRINEILREMEQDPELAQALRDTILGQEISMLPAAVAQNQGLIIQLMERQVELASAVNTALDAVVSAMSQAGENTAVALEAHGRRIEGVESALAELREEGHRTRESLGQVLSGVKQLQTDMTETRADVKQLQTDVAETKADVKQLQSDMAETKTDVKQLRSDMAETKADVKQLRSDMAETKADVKQLRSDMAETKADVKQVQSDVRRIDGRLDRGFGTNYEAKVAQNVRSILGQQAGVRSSRVLKGPSLRTDRDFDRQVESAEASGVITEDESDELLLLDLIVSGTRTGTRERVYVGIEVSITANDDDVNRAVGRAEILMKVTGGPVIAVVIADRVEAQQTELATLRGVAIAVHPE